MTSGSSPIPWSPGYFCAIPLAPPEPPVPLEIPQAPGVPPPPQMAGASHAQSDSHELQFSAPLQMPSPQMDGGGHWPQSCGQELQVSRALQIPSPHAPHRWCAQRRSESNGCNGSSWSGVLLQPMHTAIEPKITIAEFIGYFL